MTEPSTPQSILPFEQAFQRLEQILEAMNSGKTPLEESLKLFAEAESLIRHCSNTLNSAEKTIQTLIKERGGGLALDPAGSPRTEAFK